MYREYANAGGYPQYPLETILSEADVDIIPTIKQHEIDNGNFPTNAGVDIILYNYSIVCEDDAWISINGGTSIPITASSSYTYSNDVPIKSLAFKNAVNYKMAYNY